MIVELCLSAEAIIGRLPTPLHSSSADGEMVRRRDDNSRRKVQNVP